eukprot:g282.t1
MKGYRTGNVRAADLVDTPQYYDPECISCRFDKLYGGVGRKEGKAGLRLAVFRLIQRDFWISGALLALSMCGTLSQPILLRSLLDHIKVGQGSISAGLWLCAGITLASTAKSLALHQFWMFGIRACLSSEIALRSALFRAAQRCASNSMPTSAAVQKGELLTLMTSDASRMSNCFMVPSFHWGTWYAAATLLVSFINLVWLLGFKAAAAGSIIALCITPVGVLVGRATYKINKRIMSHRDCRGELLRSFISSARVLKAGRLEECFGRDIFSARKSEMTEQRRQQCLGIMGWAFSTFAPLFVSVAAFAVHVYEFRGAAPSAPVAFAAVAWFDVLREGIQNVPWAITSVSKTLASLTRLEKFFENSCTETMQERTVIHDIDAKRSLPGDLVCLAGPVGSGKSTLLWQLALKESARVGSVGYVGQSPWIMSGTVEENIRIFGSSASDDREGFFAKVIASCALDEDLSRLPHGKDTRVGPDGVRLSGGQRQRIALARAVYSRAGAYYLDDVLSAVDNAVAEKIFRDCICGLLLKSSAVTLVSSARAEYAHHSR